MTRCLYILLIALFAIGSHTSGNAAGIASSLSVVGNGGLTLGEIERNGNDANPRAAIISAENTEDAELGAADSMPQLQSKQRRRPLMLRLLDKALEVDTNYIERDRYNITLMTQSEWRYKSIWLRGSDEDGHHQTIYFHPHSQVTIGPYVRFSILSFGWTVDIGSKLTTNNSNLYFSVYAPMFGFDYYYEKDINGYNISRLSGFPENVRRDSEGLGFPGLSTNMKYLHVYYIFNHRHLSYPAAYSQSTVQRRSSGAMILGYAYSRQQTDFDYNLLPAPFYNDSGELIINEALKARRTRYTNHSLSLGYTYNWVFARNWLFNASASPAIGYNFTKGESLTSEKLYKLRNLNFDFIGKLGIVWNCQRLFAGGSFTAHTYTYTKPTFSCQNSLLSAQLYVGINLWRKKQRANS